MCAGEENNIQSLGTKKKKLKKMPDAPGERPQKGRRPELMPALVHRKPGRTYSLREERAYSAEQQGGASRDGGCGSDSSPWGLQLKYEKRERRV